MTNASLRFSEIPGPDAPKAKATYLFRLAEYMNSQTDEARTLRHHDRMPEPPYPAVDNVALDYALGVFHELITANLTAEGIDEAATWLAAYCWREGAIDHVDRTTR